MDKFFRDLLGLPVLASEHGKDVDNLIIYVHWLMIALFIGWLGYFVYVIFRFRREMNPKADYVGVKNHASNYIEVAVAAVEFFLLFVLAIPYWYRAVDKFPDPKEATIIQVVAEQFDWNVRYPGRDGVFGNQNMHLVTQLNKFGVDPADSHGKDDVQVMTQIHVVVNKPVIVYISSRDVIHSFKIIAMRVTQDAIPGMRVPVHFTPTRAGNYQINCAQLCGNSHFGMSRGMLIVESQQDFDKWIASKAGASPANYE